MTFLIATPSWVCVFVAALREPYQPGPISQHCWSIPYDAIGTLSQFLGHRISLVNNEVLVEDLEDLPAL